MTGTPLHAQRPGGLGGFLVVGDFDFLYDMDSMNHRLLPPDFSMFPDLLMAAAVAVASLSPWLCL